MGLEIDSCQYRAFGEWQAAGILHEVFMWEIGGKPVAWVHSLALLWPAQPSAGCGKGDTEGFEECWSESTGCDASYWKSLYCVLHCLGSFWWCSVGTFSGRTETCWAGAMLLWIMWLPHLCHPPCSMWWSGWQLRFQPQNDGGFVT